jgi:hypothetical protein
LIDACVPGKAQTDPASTTLKPTAAPGPEASVLSGATATATKWSDRRMIGAIYWSDPGFVDYRVAPDGWSWVKEEGCNPNGWNPHFFGDLDARKPGYVSEVQKRMWDFYVAALDRTEASGRAQGVYEHDLEGSAYPSRYNGDAVTSTPPEMSVDFIKRRVDEAARRKLGWGCCIRQTNPVWTDAGKVQQRINGHIETVAWHLQTLRYTFGDNVQYVYFDTNHMSWDNGVPNPMPAADITKAQSTVPGRPILVMAEVGTPNAPSDKDMGYTLTKWQRDHWGSYTYYTAPNVASWRWTHTPVSAMSRSYIKRGGFDVIVPIVTRDPTPAEYAQLVQDIRDGCIMLFTATWDAPWNVWIFKAYDEAKSTSPTTAPTSQPVLQRAVRQSRPNPSEFKLPMWGPQPGLN